MNKTELVKAISTKSEVSAVEVGKVVNALLEVVGEELKNGGEVVLAGFGTFKVSERAERVGRNPQTGEEIKVPATKVPVFKAGKGLKDQVK